MGKRAALETLGCKVNQYESIYFLEALAGAGYELTDFRESADLYVVHGCAVTSRAAYQTRQLLRRAQRINASATIVVAGCAAQLEAERLAGEGLATHILGNSTKFDLLSWIDSPGAFSSPCTAIADPRLCRACGPLPVNRMLTGRARALLKVQDGCDSFCTYCIVPLVRGKSLSISWEHVRVQMDRFLNSGYREVVLTGIHLGQWGKDLLPQQELADLLVHLSQGPLPPRIRLSSLEPMECNSRLMELLRTRDWICPHFHVPLQSGDEEILKRMGRPYSPQEYSEIIRELHRLRPMAAIGADVMACFPEETERRFENTCRLIESLPLSYLHVFPYSPRPGTAAAQWTVRIEGTEIKRRTHLLRQIGSKKRQDFLHRSLGTCVEVLVETNPEDNWWQGTSENYIPVVFRSSKPLSPGSLVRARLMDVSARAAVGELLSFPS
jgi:threonylcarbamoyladenosine tRNA methylthiotransferase MtaB